eukprot:CAMPEP_0119406480 /NCGR_PEP_ID=MMETSP1335-20130426/783_1 /TAXON_ID=259385 /ORGANISM="Chrysoculter rhomboideus, Strain RCC1486" /LENGTH=286 /DNA_ID=CAMNT_0007430559 /DNA_START=22 /DNA_END=882 /DNA_ORIENTATION=-
MADGRVRPAAEAALLPYLPRMTPKVYAGFMGWIFCIYFLLIATPPATPPERMENYKSLMSFAASDPAFVEVEREMIGLVRARDDAKVLFWSWRSPYKDMVREMQAQIDELAPRYNAAVDDRDRTRTRARQEVGLWSDVGVGEMRALFWRSWDEGKDFAKRMTFWDIMFATSRREETLVSVLVRWLSTFLMNLSVGLCAAVFWFSGRVISLIFAYQPPLYSGLTFGVVAILGAAGTVLLFMAVLYSVAIGGAYFAIKASAENARLQHERAREQAYLRGGGARRAHYD